jgi:hypothetical protein
MNNDFDEADIWKVEVSRYDAAAFALIVGSTIGAIILSTWFIGSILGAW